MTIEYFWSLLRNDGAMKRGDPSKGVQDDGFFIRTILLVILRDHGCRSERFSVSRISIISIQAASYLNIKKTQFKLELCFSLSIYRKNARRDLIQIQDFCQTSYLRFYLPMIWLQRIVHHLSNLCLLVLLQRPVL